ncbi:MAG: ABC transporter permease [Desulforhopalus sp.]|nr:ABC transporter permease [Desulforhopalus sp.]
MNGVRNSRKEGSPWLILSLAAKDLRHELILSLCLVMAVTAVLGPVLVLFGLKFGSVQLLRSRLIEDPRNREIRPISSARYQPEWFLKMQGMPETAFITPMTRQISTSVDACVAGSDSACNGEPVSLDLLPTGAGDPLLLENKGIIPGPDGCVLTRFAAEKAGAKTGDRIRVIIRRVIGGDWHKAALTLHVDAVLDARAGATKAMFVPLSVLEQVESYKDGEAVPERGWKGKQRTAFAEFNGLLVWLPAPLTKLEQIKLRTNTGFSTVRVIKPAEMEKEFGFSITAPGSIYFLTTQKRAARQDNIDNITHRLRGRDAILLPMAAPVSALLTEDGATRNVTLRSLGFTADTAKRLQISPLPRWALPPADSPNASLQAFTAGENNDHSLSRVVQVDIHEKNSLTLPLLLYGETDSTLYIPAELGGILRLLRDRPVHYDAENNAFLLSRQGYAGFRLYTTTIDEVDSLRRNLAKEGISVATEADRIRDVQELNHYLGLIFYVIAAAAAAGGAATLAASLYGSVERKRREIGILRLLGFSRFSLLRFPLYQGIILTFGGFVVASIFFFALSLLINNLFAEMIRENESLCTLTPVHFALFAAVMLAIAVVAALGAAVRILRLEPVEALRDE